MELQPTIENDLVLLRPVNEDDLEPLFQVASDPLIWNQHRFKRYLRSEFETFFNEMIRSKSALIIKDQLNGHIIGSSGFKKITGFTDGLEIGGTFIARDYWGSLYNRTVKKMMINHALHYVDYVLFHVHKANIRSQKAVEKLNGLKVSSSEFKQIPLKSKDHLRYLICNQCGPDLQEPVDTMGQSKWHGS